MKKLVGLFAILTSFLPAVSFAANQQINANPKDWRLQHYVGDNLTVAWYTGSTCNQGNIQLITTNEAVKNRFWSTITTAKAANRNVVIFYEDTQNCRITSFSLE